MPASIFKDATTAKVLRPNLDLNGTCSVLQGSADPTAVAQSAPAGSLYLMSTGRVFKKMDAGATTNWLELITSSNLSVEPRINRLLNTNFDYWQRGTSTTVGITAAATTTFTANNTATITVASGTGIVVGQQAVGTGIPANTLVNSVSGTSIGLSNSVPTNGGGVAVNFYPASNAGYQADRWYAKNSLGPGGVLTYSRVTGTNAGAKYGCSVKVSTAPTANQANGCELYQTLENLDSLQFYNNSASFWVKVQALGNVTQVGIQLYYATTEAKVTTAIGSEVLTTVNSSGFANCIINGQAVGTAQGAAGVIGVRIRPTAVSSGNLYDLNNGFVAEQAMLTLGSSTPSEWSRAMRDAQAELSSCQRYYEKSWDLATAVGTATATGAVVCNTGTNTTGVVSVSVPFAVRKRLAGGVTIWDTAGNNGGGAGRVGTTNAAGSGVSNNVGIGNAGSSESNFFVSVTQASTAGMTFHWTADSEI